MITFLMVLPALIAFVLQLVFCPVGIPILHKLKFGQYIRELGPKEHQKKAGTPTMGGVMILIAFLLGVVLAFRFDIEILMLLFLVLGFGVIGFLDDYLKVARKNNDGLKAWQKWALQCVVSLAFVLYMALGGTYTTALAIPFTTASLELGWFYYVLAFFFILAFVNGVNFTDGLDGLASSVTSVVAGFFLLVCWRIGSTLAIPAASMLGALLGFLCFNLHPAKVFMGDTGSLALGGFVSGMALLLNRPLILVVVGLIYVAEVLSVVLQVAYFKATHGKRLFRMAPIHHHFELGGWSETKVVGVFSIVTILLSMLSLIG